jgi:hypothetical protein
MKNIDLKTESGQSLVINLINYVVLKMANLFSKKEEPSPVFFSSIFN